MEDNQQVWPKKRQNCGFDTACQITLYRQDIVDINSMGSLYIDLCNCLILICSIQHHLDETLCRILSIFPVP